MKMDMLTKYHYSLNWLLFIIFSIINVNTRSIVNGFDTPEGECQHYYGGVSGANLYTCCNFPGTECEDEEFIESGGIDYCSDGNSNEVGSAQELGGSFECRDSCDGVKECKAICDNEANNNWAGCWEWSLCFDECCRGTPFEFLKLPFKFCSADGDRRLQGSSSSCGQCETHDISDYLVQQCPSYCGDGNCDDGECPSNCPEDCSSPAPTSASTTTTAPVSTGSTAPVSTGPTGPTGPPGGGGDPHFFPFRAWHYSIHPQCEMILTKSDGFHSGLGLYVFIRTTKVMGMIQNGYSYISAAAIKVGSDVVEIQGDGSLIVNGNDTFNNKDAATLEVASGIFSLAKTTNANKDEMNHVAVGTPIYDLYFRDDTGDMCSIQVSTNKWEMMFVNLFGIFPVDSVGLLGSPAHLPLFARDGKTDLRSDHNALGDEWQVRSDEPQLFQDKTYVPQHPERCIYEEIGGSEKSNIRRRLNLDNPISPKAATEACAQASDYKREACIQDVLATGFLELASDSFYQS